MLFYFCFVFVIIYLVIIMDKLDFDFKVNDLDLKVNFQKAKEDKSFCKLINSLNLKEEILCKYTSMLKDSAEEINNCRHCKGLNDCKNSVVGSFLAPQNNNNGLVFSYIDCHYKSDSKYKENVSLFDMPLRLKDACITNIYTDDKIISQKALKYIAFRNYQLYKNDVKFEIVNSLKEYIEKESPSILKLVISSKKDLGSVIGRNGVIANAIRTVVKSLGSGKEKLIIKFDDKDN